MHQRRSAIITLTALLLGVPVIAVAQTITSVTLSPNSVMGGQKSAGQVRLSGPAPSGGFVVQLSSTHPAAAYSISSSVIVPAGATTQNFTVTTVGVGQSTAVTIAAFAGGVSRTVLLNVQALLSSVTLGSPSVRGGFGTGGIVRLFVPAPAGGVTIQLSSSNPAAATVPAGVTVRTGAMTADFTVTAVPVAQSATVTITAAVDGVSKTAPLTVEPTVLLYLVLGPASLRGGVGSTGEVELSGPAPSGGFAVTLSSGDPAVATVPARVTVPARATTAQFPITTRRVAKVTGVTITASTDGGARTRQLMVNP